MSFRIPEGKDFVNHILSPLVVVLSTPEADEIAIDNTLVDFCQFITPFGSRIQGQVQAENVQGHAFVLDSFTLRFRLPKQLNQPQGHAISKTIDHIVQSKYSEFDSRKLISIKDRVALEKFRNEANFDDLTPWYADYREIHCKYTGVSEHETFHHPVAYLIVVSTLNSDPLAEATKLYDQTIQSSELKKIYFDKTIPRLYLLVHDVVKASHVNADELFNQFQKHVNPCYLLKLNSRPGSTTVMEPSVVPDIWMNASIEIQLIESFQKQSGETAANPQSPIKQASALQNSSSPLVQQFPKDVTSSNNGKDPSPSFLGNRLSQADFSNVDIFMKDFVVKNVIHYMSNAMKEWERDIASSRRGISGRLLKVGLKYFGNSKNSTPHVEPVVTKKGETIFPMESPEFLMRKLADYAFMLRDYRFALSIYDTVKKDFQGSEKLGKYLAGVLEMIGICGLIVDMSRGPFEPILDASIGLYKEFQMKHFTERCSIFYYELLKERHLYKEAAGLFIKAAGDDLDLKSSLLLEQAAVCFLRCYPMMFREYIFHLTLAGHRFLKCGHRFHGIRNYQTALESFDSIDWGSIKDHINFTLGRQAFQLNQIRESLDYFIQLIGTTRQNANQQNFYLREFLYIYNSYSQNCTMQDLLSLMPLNRPLLDFKDIVISLQPIPIDKKTRKIKKNLKRNSQLLMRTNRNEDELFERLEKKLLNEKYSGHLLSEFQTTRQSARSLKGAFTCLMNEPVFFTFEWHNDMNIPLPANCVFLECQVGDECMDSSQWPIHPGMEPPALLSNSFFDVEVLPDVSLDAHEKKIVEIKIIPKQLCQIKILSLHYLICGVMPTHIPIRKESTNDCIVLDVKPHMPVLNVALNQFPDTAFVGQMVPLEFEATNTGCRALTQLCIVTNQPHLFYFSNKISIQSIEIEMDNDNLIEPNSLMDKSCITLKLVNDTLEPGASISIPFMMRANETGVFYCNFVFGYVAKNDSTRSLKTCRCSRTFQAIPSLRVNAFIKPCISSIHKSLVGLEIENLQSSQIRLSHILAQSPTWIIENQQEDISSLDVNGDSSHLLMFNAKRADHQFMLEPIKLQTPEHIVTKAIEQLVMLQDIEELNAPNVSLRISKPWNKQPMHLSSELSLHEMTHHARLGWRMMSMQSQYPGLNASQISKLFTLYFTEDLDFILFWEIPGQSIVGFHHLGGMNLGLEPPLQLQARLAPRLKDAALKGEKTLLGGGRALFESTAREKKELVNSLFKSSLRECSPIRVILSFQELNIHSFQTNGHCIVPIKIEIRNTSWMDVAFVKLELQKSTTDSYCFIGKSTFLESIRPETSIVKTVNVAFFSTGLFNLNCWKLFVDLGEKDEMRSLTQVPNAARYIQIQSHD